LDELTCQCKCLERMSSFYLQNDDDDDGDIGGDGWIQSKKPEPKSGSAIF